MSDFKRTEIQKVGEFGLIEKIKKRTKVRNQSTIKGIGDDAAVLAYNENEYLITSTDILFEHIHFDLSYTPLKHLGYKCIAVNVSDIAAMNGTPLAVTVSLGLSNRVSVEAIEELYTGMEAACEDFKVDLVGGDTSASPSGLMINVSINGIVSKDKVTYRSGANEGDILCVTGDLGGAYMGLNILMREKEEFLANPDMQPSIDQYDYIVQRLLKPVARMDIIHDFKDKGIVPTSMIDISDGIASELHHLSQQSEVGFKILNENMPIAQMTKEVALEFNISPDTCMFNGGEDYELLFTVKKNDLEKVKNHPDIHIIGEVCGKNEGINLITKGGNIIPIQAQGWNHFA